MQAIVESIIVDIPKSIIPPQRVELKFILIIMGPMNW